MTAEVELAPIAGAFYHDNSEAACIMGPIGSGKTHASCLRVARHADEQWPGPDGVARTRMVLVRNTKPQLFTNTKATWDGLFPVNGKTIRFVSTQQMYTWRYRHAAGHVVHAEILLRALDDPDDVANLLGLEVTGFYFNELRELEPDVIAQASTRAGRYPNAAAGGCKWRGWFSDSNPWAMTSRFHEWFVADPRPGFAFFKQPGGMDPAAENLENLEQTLDTLKLPVEERRAIGRTYYERALLGYNKYDADTMVHCRYGVSRSGKPVYASFDDNVHTKLFELVRYKDKSGKPYTPVWVGYDNTGRHPAAVIAQRVEENGKTQWRCRYEFIGDGIGMRAHAHALRMFLADKVPDARIVRITCDPAGAAKGADDLDMRGVIQHEFPGVMVVNARTNEIETRIAAVENVLTRQDAFVLHPDCRILRTACLTKYQYRKLKLSGEERFTETPDKISPFADAADALQYLLLGGGEGRVLQPDEQGANFKWPRGGQIAITPKPSDQQRRTQGAVFDPRVGPFFHER